jgi:signal transduction histidine kinase/ligand-binding sensor domain-containing protein
MAAMFLSARRSVVLLAACRLALAGILLGISLRVYSAPADYLVDVWGTADDLPGSSVTAITQTPDGYLWVGTYDGLARFDGVRFVTFDPGNTPALSHSRVQGLYLDARGTLWINTFRGGLTSYRDGVFRREWPDRSWFDFRTSMVSSTSNQIIFVTQLGQVLKRALNKTNADWEVVSPAETERPIFQCGDREGTLWFLSREGHVLRIHDNKFEPLSDSGGLGKKRVFTLASDKDGNVWAGAENEIAQWNGSTFVSMTPTNMDASEKFEPNVIFPTSKGTLWVLSSNGQLRQQQGRQWIAEASAWRGLLGWTTGRGTGVHEDREGGIWFNHYGNGLFHITPDGRYERFTMRDGLPGDRVATWFQDKDGGVWLGAYRGGLARLRERHFHVIGTAEGLPAQTALSICQSSNHDIWIGTGNGLCRWRNGKLSTYNVGNTASDAFVFSVFPGTNDELWLSAGEGEDLFQFRDGHLQRAPWEVHGVKSMLRDHTGRLWLGTKSDVSWWQPDARRTINGADGMSISAVRALAETPDGTIWCGTDDGTLYRCQTNHVEPFRPGDSLGTYSIWSLMADRDGTLWAGTFRGGLLRFRDGKFTRFSAKQGLPAEVISQILEDDRGRLWLGTHRGICCVEKSALEACASGRADTVDAVTYIDGLPSSECSDGYQPACLRASDGRLWFSTAKGVVSVNPDDWTTTSSPPPVVIEELRVDGEILPLTDGKIIVPPGHKQFEFRFTSPSFDAPDKTRFRYRMDTLDNDWVDMDSRRTAHYGHLAPGHYRFRVIACNSAGVWNKTGASLEFNVQPYFYQTRWFITMASLFVLGAVGVGVRTVAARKYRRELARMAQQHAIERDRARIAKDIHDDIGAGLTQITLLSELARREPAQAGSQLDRISDAARDLTRSMDEIVWAVDPQHDTLASLMDYISAYTEDFLRTANIRYRTDLPPTLPGIQVDAELRYNLFLALKEALNNVVKHAHATEVWLRLKLEPASFTLIVEDNGQGFGSNNGHNTVSTDRIYSGSGLGNLKKRLAAVGGQCIIQSSAGKGTRVEMTAVIESAISPVVAIGPEEAAK